MHAHTHCGEAPGLHPSTRQLMSERRHAALIRVVRHMRANLQSELDLDTLAEVACCSRFHFVRIFAEQCGVTPMNFLSSLRIQAAKSALLQTEEKVIDVAYGVGYSSLGSFGRRFTELVGLSPRALRNGARQFIAGRFCAALAEQAAVCSKVALPHAIRGRIEARGNSCAEGFVFIGLFRGNQPSGVPAACTLARYPGPFQLPMLLDGADDLTLFAAGIEHSGDPYAILLSCGLQVARLSLSNADCTRPLHIRLETQKESEPPVLLALPLLFQNRAERQPSLAAAGTAKDRLGYQSVPQG